MKKLSRHIIASLCLTALSVPVAHAGWLPTEADIDNMLGKLGADGAFDDSKIMDWGILPGPFYTPELSFGVGLAAIGMYRPDNSDAATQNSTLSVSGFLSATGAVGLGLENYNFFLDDRIRLFIRGSLNNMSTYYWGTGYANGRNDDGKEKYTEQSAAIAPDLMFRVGYGTYLGLGWDYSASHAKNTNDVGDSLFDKERDGRSVTTSGLSASFSYDTRDFLANARYGHAVNLKYTYFSPDFGGDNRFSSFQGSYDWYQSVGPNIVLAFDAYTHLSTGDVPWDRMAELGDSRRMRGYYQGRYRDRNVFSTQFEFRQKLNWRHGYVLWVGTGTMSHHVTDLGKKHWLPNGGIGYRFEFKPRMNIRLDFGVGKGSYGFYFQVGEAF